MNSDETWLLELWSGTFGASIGAAAAAGVALLVVRRSNNHQAKLAAETLRLQRDEAIKALKEARDEARRSRCSQALGDFVVSVQGLPARALVGNTSTEVYAAKAAVARLSLEGVETSVIRSLTRFVDVLRIAASSVLSREAISGASPSEVSVSGRAYNDLIRDSRRIVDEAPLIFRCTLRESSDSDLARFEALV